MHRLNTSSDPDRQHPPDDLSRRYHALLNSLDQGFCVLEVLFGPAGDAVDYRVLEVNAAFEGLTGLRDPVGGTMRELMPGHAGESLPVYERVVRTGRPERFVAQARHLGGRWFDAYAFRVDGRVGVLFSDVTARKALERQQAYLLGLGDALRPLTDPLAVQREACRRLGAEVEADRAYYCEVDEAAGEIRITHDFARGEAASLVGRYALAAFGWVGPAFRAGRPVVVEDVATTPLLADADRPPLAALAIGAFVAVPLVKGGRLVGLLCVTAAAPRGWAAEVGLVAETAERTWAAVERARAEEAVRASEARLRAFADTAPAVLWVTEPDGSCSLLSRGWYELTGQSEAAALGFGWLDAVHPDDRAAARDAFLAANARGEPFALEHRLRRADGVYRWVLDAGRPRLGPGGAFLGYVGSVIDIDDRKRAEAELFASREALRAVLDTIPQRVFWKARDLTYLGCNRPFARDMGFDTPEEVVGKTDFQGAWAEMAERFRADDRRVLETAAPKLDYEEVVVAADGSRQWVRTSKQPLRGPDGRVAGVLGTYEDVSERHRLEEQLREQERQLREAAELAHVGGWSFDPVTLKGDWTAETARIHGADPSAAPDVASGLSYFDPADRPRIEAAVRAAIESGTPYDLELRLTAGDGTRKWVRTIGRAVVEGGRVVRVRGSMQDVTARHELEEQLRQSQKMDAMGQLAGGVAHDFNNLLTVINGYADVLLEAFPPGDPARPMVAEVRRAGERSAGLTRQLLAFSRRQVLAPRVLDLNALVAEAERLLRRVIGEDVRLETDLAPGLGAVRADPGQLEQVLLNLAVNARDAMPRGGRLTIATREEEVGAARPVPGLPDGPHVVLEVSDTGCGMTDAVRARIFEPFFTTKGPGQGTGLGLATVFGIVQQSGGAVRVETAVGAGSKFRVYLPRADEPAPAGLGSGARAVPRGSETVLLVEDEPGVRGLARRVLAGYGYTVLEAGDGAAALAAVARHPGPVHLLLTDVVMPGPGGREVAERVRAISPGARVLFMSGYTDDAVVRHGVAAEQVNFIQKPFAPAALALKVREVLDGPPA